MLTETKPLRQYSGEYRRLFQDDEFDLFLWFSSDVPNADLVGFQLCYDKFAREQALTWHKDAGFSHSLVDTGDDSPKANRTPVLVKGGEFPAQRVTALFQQRSSQLDPIIARFVQNKLDEYASL